MYEISSTKNKEKYNYILEWVKRSRYINDLKSFFDFVFRIQSEENLKKFGEEPLKTAWESLTVEEQILLTDELSAFYLRRLRESN